MNITLTPRAERLLEERLASGPYHQPEKVIERALEALAEKEATGQLEAGVDHTLARFDAFLDALAADSDEIPPMLEETFSRGMIYQDHD